MIQGGYKVSRTLMSRQQLMVSFPKLNVIIDYQKIDKLQAPTEKQILLNLNIQGNLSIANDETDGKIVCLGELSRSRIGSRPGQYPRPDGSLALEDHRRLERGSTPEFSSPARQSASQP